MAVSWRGHKPCRSMAIASSYGERDIHSHEVILGDQKQFICDLVCWFLRVRKPADGSRRKLGGRFRVPKPARRRRCRREVARNDWRTATAVTPSRWRPQ